MFLSSPTLRDIQASWDEIPARGWWVGQDSPTHNSLSKIVTAADLRSIYVYYNKQGKT
ncbi:MAG: hypothetical protein HFG28_09045 [Eubacterium sp.]|nr:hypothetical protein [Eubacterium sp.]